MSSSTSPDPTRFSEFATRWSLIVGGQQRSETWQHLVKRYRGPILSWVRRRLRSSEQAEDIALDFFSYLYDQRLLEKADPSRGRFRAFLQGVLKNYLRTTLRPGPFASGLDEAELDRAVEPDDAVAEAEEVDWARRVLQNACKALLEQKPRDGEILLRYYGIKPFAKATAPELCAEFGLTANALDFARFAARKRLRALIEEEVRETTGDPEAFAEELEVLQMRLLSTHGALFGEA